MGEGFAWPELDELSWWIAGFAWIGWLLLGNGRTRLTPADCVRDGHTFVFALVTLLSCVALAVLLAAVWPAAAMPGPAWVWRVVGACIAGLGIALREWAVRTLGASFTQIVAFRRDQALVRSGPYRYVRHPGYAGSLLTMTGLGLTLATWSSLAVLAVGTFIAHLPRIHVEERALEEQFGDSYREFARRRRRLIPGIW